MFLIAYTFKGQVCVFAGQVKIISHLSCRTSAILKYFCSLWVLVSMMDFMPGKVSMKQVFFATITGKAVRCHGVTFMAA